MIWNQPVNESLQCYVKNRPLKGKGKETIWEAIAVIEWEMVAIQSRPVAQEMRTEWLEFGHIEG